ncbi:hypothetical protein JTE90_025709 [Oedothorax gibbosus]|uniref:Transmembrane protein n=1 Tax=Oedothorax gibbosus TaxID=931172 RepID=A0AAV6UH89_9ARAC|nr:hypothetical protein JTE90_025709 [Oedothorax gibbosus]
MEEEQYRKKNITSSSKRTPTMQASHLIVLLCLVLPSSSFGCSNLMCSVVPATSFFCCVFQQMCCSVALEKLQSNKQPLVECNKQPSTPVPSTARSRPPYPFPFRYFAYK